MEKSSAHPGLGEVSDKLDDLWIEIGKRKWCPNNCKYCFSEVREDEPLSIEQVLDLLEQFKQAGGKTLAIPGAGEPFHPKSRNALFAVLDYCKENDIHATIFTEGTYITDDIADRLIQYDTARFLIKCNSRNPEIQDEIVQRKGYTKLRDAAIKRLIDRGFADKDDAKARVGIVTSVMTENFAEVADLLRYARKEGLIFDCDTIIDRGKGKECGLKLYEDQIKLAIERLQKIDREEFGRDWKITSTYVGSPPCTRFSRHLYVRQNGIVHPCVGSPGVVLGDVKKQSLQDIWNSEVMKIIRDHKYIGPCTSCKNFQEEECYSCLGRRAPNLTTEKIIKWGAVPLESTCFNFRDCKK
ncbi:radical SAM protein [Candidatus Woesearchaeota archaeon]|nr:radical SAM protein [Candidatus Woesearchaeota archaeon]